MSDLLPWFTPWSGRLLAFVVFAVGCGITWRGWRKKRTETPYCPRCRYNLTGSVCESCPECGHIPNDRNLCHQAPRRKKIILLGLLIAMLLPTFVVYRRVNVYGWAYYTYVGPLYWILPNKLVRDERVGPFRLRIYMDRRAGILEPSIGHYHLDPGDIRFTGRPGRWVWDLMNGGKSTGWQGLDINANGKPDLVLMGGFFYAGQQYDIRRYELIEGKAVLVEEFVNTTGFYVNARGEDRYYFNPDGGDILVFDPKAPGPALRRYRNPPRRLNPAELRLSPDPP